MSAFESIAITDLKKRYKKSQIDSLKSISFNIPKGSRTGILGPNGAGKSTLISIICGILEPTSGSVKFTKDDGSAFEGNDLKKQIGFVPQEYALYEDLTLMQNIEYFGALYELSKDQIQERAKLLITEFDLLDVGNKKVKGFSGGMKRRVNLILSILHQPSILFLDEPTAGVDVQNKHAIINYLKKLNELGITLIYSSHHLDEAEQLCDNIILLNKGEIVANDTIDQLMNQTESKSLTELFLSLTNG